MAKRLSFDAIIELVGDKPRALFQTGDLSIMWWEHELNQVRSVYRYEHGRPLPMPPARPITPGEPLEQMLHSRHAGVLNTREEQTQMGLKPYPGTDWAHSVAAVPIIGSERVLGVIGLQDHEREYAFGATMKETSFGSCGCTINTTRFSQTTTSPPTLSGSNSRRNGAIGMSYTNCSTGATQTQTLRSHCS